MKVPTYVTEVAGEDARCISTVSILLPMDDRPDPSDFNKTIEWENKNRWLIDYSVEIENRKEATQLAVKLYESRLKNDVAESERILAMLRGIKAKDFFEKTEQEKWDHMAMQRPGDWGPASWEKKAELRDIVTSLCHGRVLEPMCGFRSYVGDSEAIKEVVALDFSREALKRYSNPERKRIQYNLEDIVKGDKMEFFEDGSFQSVASLFAIDYITNPVPVYDEFYRILSDDGSMLVVDGPGQGYKEIKKRKFNPEVCSKYMEKAGFKTKVKTLSRIKMPFECEGYFLVTGKKKA